MRGKAERKAKAILELRITPAYAGKSSTFEKSAFFTRDHPRLCGEKFLLFSFEQFRIGSPPPMRGKASKQLKPFLKDRITPAYAGKSRLPAYYT